MASGEVWLVESNSLARLLMHTGQAFASRSGVPQLFMGLQWGAFLSLCANGSSCEHTHVGIRMCFSVFCKTHTNKML